MIILWVFWMLWVNPAGCLRNVNLMVLLPYNFSASVGADQKDVALDLAVENANKKYAGSLNISITYIFNASLRNVESFASQSVQLVAEYYFQDSQPDTCYAIETCAWSDWAGITSLANGYNWPVFLNGFAKRGFLSSRPEKQPKPVIALAGTYPAQPLLKLMDYYQWRRATILVETKQTSAFYNYRDWADALVARSREPGRAEFKMTVSPVDVNSNDSVAVALESARLVSRVIILLTVGPSAMKILRLAATLGLTNGEYVFINVKLLQEDIDHRDLYEHFSNNTASTVLRSLIILVMKQPSSAQLSNLNSALAERTRNATNLTDDGYDNADVKLKPLASLAVQISSNIVDLLATVVNESLPDGQCDGLQLAQHMFNRRFHLPAGDYQFNAEASRNADLDILSFNVSTMSIQSVGVYAIGMRAGSQEGMFIWSKERKMDWPTLNGLPPMDVPACGFSGTEGPCRVKALTPTIIAIVCVLSVLTLAILGWVIRMHYDRTLALDDWLLDPECYQIIERIPFYFYGDDISYEYSS